MSLKDDFLEALRSVKKDFFKDYEYTESKSAAAEPEPEFSQVFTSHVTEPSPDSMSPPYAADGMQAGEYDAADVSDGSISASTGPDFDDNWSADLHNGGIDDQDEENLAPDVDPTPFRTVMDFDDERADDDGDDNNGPPRDGRMIFDDGGGNYSDDRTIISKNTVIRGALQTEDSVRMFGQILGDIDCKSNILVAGKVRGNTSAANAYVIDAQVDGNLLCDDVVNITDDAWILGNIRAQQAEIDGKIKGNIEIRHTISIGSNSSVIGNISTDELEIKRGAFVNGQIMMYSPSRDVIDRFDQFEK